MFKPISLALAALSLSLAAAGSARADATYYLDLHGTDQRDYPICRVPGQAGPCDETVELPWTGTLTIVLDSASDGVFPDTDVLSFSFQSNLVSLSLSGLPGGSVTVADGSITAIDLIGFPVGEAGRLTSVGLHMTYDNAPDPREVSDSAAGDLLAVPEPGSAALMLLALAWVGAGARARRGGGARHASGRAG